MATSTVRCWRCGPRGPTTSITPKLAPTAIDRAFASLNRLTVAYEPALTLTRLLYESQGVMLGGANEQRGVSRANAIQCGPQTGERSRPRVKRCFTPSLSRTTMRSLPHFVRGRRVS